MKLTLKLNRLGVPLLSMLMAANFWAASASADLTEFREVCAGRIVPINSLQWVLYKSENIHGGRGPTFLVQNRAERTGKQVIEIRDARCHVIGSFGLYATDYPYGARYYSRTGGSGASDQDLLARARAAGSTNILVEGVGGKWIRVKDPTLRDGTIQK